MTEYEFPILGEPLPVELANTRYESSPDSIDFLSDLAAVPSWFAAIDPPAPLPCPDRPSRTWHRQLLELRDATRAVLDALAATTTPADDDFAAIAALAAGANRKRSLAWDDGPRLTICYEGPAGRRELAALADVVIDFLASDQAALVRTCAADDCSMLFVRHHHRRRWCNDGCSHRVRQARYYRRRKARADE